MHTTDIFGMNCDIYFTDLVYCVIVFLHTIILHVYYLILITVHDMVKI